MYKTNRETNFIARVTGLTLTRIKPPYLTNPLYVRRNSLYIRAKLSEFLKSLSSQCFHEKKPN